ncbi:MAG: hypothetical protein IPG50_08420 [Myxococcales bacterium]|nr:hypothetical protein [Myxococcales bacterium]
MSATPPRARFSGSLGVSLTFGLALAALPACDKRGGEPDAAGLQPTAVATTATPATAVTVAPTVAPTPVPTLTGAPPVPVRPTTTTVKTADGGVAVVAVSDAGVAPTTAPTFAIPTALPSGFPTALPSGFPTTLPTVLPTALPSGFPTIPIPGAAPSAKK